MTSKLAVSTLHAKDIMTEPVISFTSMTTVKEAIEQLIRHQISGAPMIEPSTNKVITIVSEADLMKLAALESLTESLGFLLDKLPATDKLIFVYPESSYAEVFKCFLKNPIRRVLVMNSNGTLAGIIARRDIIKSMLDNQTKNS